MVNGYKFAQLVDIQQIKNLLESYFITSGMLSAILDNEEKVLVAVGWQDICTNFHRVNPISCLHCRESDAYIKANLNAYQEGFLEYKCKNGLWDVAFPIVIAGEHLATFFIGQFFYEDDQVNMDFFLNQAKEFGFNIDEYFDALKRVPIHSRESIHATMSFYRNLVGIMAENGLKKLKLAREIEEHKHVENTLIEREATLRAITTSAQDAIVMMDSEGKISFWNESAVAMFGWNQAEVLGHDLHDLIAPRRFREAHRSEMGHFVRSGQGHAIGKTLELPALRKDKTEFPVELSLSSVKVGGEWHAVGIIRDITGRKHLEEALRENEKQLSRALEITRAGHWDYDVASDTFTFNDNFYRMFRTSAEQVVGYRMSSAEYAQKFCHPDDMAMVAREIQMAVAATDADSERQVEHRIIYGDGEIGHIAVRHFVIRDRDGRTIRTYGVNQDITERKKAEEERLAHLRYFESMDRINRAMQGTGDLEQMLSDVLDVTLSIFDCDRAFLVYPCDPEAPSWYSPMERTRPEYPGLLSRGTEMPMDAETAALLQILLDSDGPVKFGSGAEYPLPEVVSKRFNILSRMSMAIYPKTGKPWQFGIHQCSYPRTWTPDEERLLKEIGRRLSDSLSTLMSYRDLWKSEEFLNRILDNLPVMLFVKDATTLKFLRFNRAGEQMLGFSEEELIGKNEYDFYSAEEADVLTARDKEALRGKKLVDIPEEIVRTKNNEERILHTQKLPILDETGKPQYLLSISEDITERKKLEEQLYQAQKMESVGRLAGGVAHDFNNMLGVIIGHAELALLKSKPDQSLYANLQEILKASDRSADLTRQLLTFARKQPIAPRELDLNEVVSEMLKMLKRLIGEDSDLTWVPGRDVWPLKMDPVQINQILVNLCINARDAISGVGRITIETSNVSIDQKYHSHHPEIVAGDYVVLAVSDNGCGMDKEMMEMVFEPFFTTKEVGKGTGLGLSTIYGIVKQNYGFIYVYSEPGHGTTFKIYLPRHAAGPSPLKAEISELPRRGHETILLVEDEPGILETTKTLLESLGYKVLVSSTPGKAIKLAQEYAGEINLLLTDVIMPEMNGRELSKRFVAFHPEATTLFMSGYTADVITNRGVLDEGVHFLQKPFSMQNLAAKVREVLDKEEQRMW